MRTRSLALAGAIMLATAACAAVEQSGDSGSRQVASTPDQGVARSSRGDWFISPNDPRYQESGAPRAGQKPVRLTPYAPIQGGGGPSGNG